MPTIITAGDASNGIQASSGNDGALTIQTGAAGSKVDAIAMDTNGQATLKQPSKLAAGATVSMVRLNTSNGYGSTNTVIRRFTNVAVNTGSDITYADSSTLGATFTINTAGVYAVSYADQFSSASSIGLSLNSTQLTTSIAGITAADKLSEMDSAGINYSVACSWAGYLSAGSVVRAHTQGVSSGANTGIGKFTIVRIA